MQITVHEVASLLGVSEKTIYRWVQQRRLPAFKINEQYRFSRAEILEWATAERINVSPDIFVEPKGTAAQRPALAEALKRGGVYYRVGGHDKAAVLKSVVDLMPLPEEVDRVFLFRVLIAREDLGSTAIGDGVAVPHVRNPIVLHVPCPMVTLCFLDQPIDYGALDGKPVQTLFTIVSPSISAHLSLLAKLAFALQQPEFAAMIARQETRERLLAAAADVDVRLAARDGNAAPAGGEAAR